MPSKSYYSGTGFNKLEITPVDRAKWHRNINNFRDFDKIGGASIQTLVNSAARQMQMVSRRNLKRMVYDSPLDSGEYEVKTVTKYHEPPEHYLARARHGLVFRAIKIQVGKKGGDTYESRCYVDSKMFYGTYYAKILNKGWGGGAYVARPFWTDAMYEVRASFRAMGPMALRDMKRRMVSHSGRFTFESRSSGQSWANNDNEFVADKNQMSLRTFG